MKYKEPEFKSNAFTCPYCQTYAEQKWYIGYLNKDSMKYYINNTIKTNVFIGEENVPKVSLSTCSACGRYHIWHNEEMIVPSSSSIPMPLDDMPKIVKKLYLEARNVYPISSKSACALLRLSVQHLCKELGEKGKNINDDIGRLVKKECQ